MKTLHFAIPFVLTLSTGIAAAPYVGVSGGYLIDTEEEYIAARVGFDVAKTPQLTHSLELEVGYSSDRFLGSKMTITPVTVNYRATAPLSKGVDLFTMVGVGGSAISVDIPRSGVWGNASDDDFTFTAQAAVGASFPLTDQFAITVAGRYIWISDTDLFGLDVEVGDDVAIEAGVTFKF